MSTTGTDIAQAARLLNDGKLVAIPTETVYGLAANALNSEAVAKIFEAKNRPHFDPLIVHTHSLDDVHRYAASIHPALLKLAQTFWPGPLTLLLPRTSIIPDLVTSGLDTVAIRIPDHPLTLKLLASLDFPLAAPSANPFGYISPTTAAHVEKQLGAAVDYILNGGPCGVGLESTIVGTEDNTVCVYRLGGLSIAEIERVVGKVELRINHSSNPKAPGQLKSHYAPRKPLFLGSPDELVRTYQQKRIGIITFGDHVPAHPNAVVYPLSLKKDYTEAATRLFSALRELDDSDVELIIAELLPAEHLGLAINDRLIRAAAR